MTTIEKAERTARKTETRTSASPQNGHADRKMSDVPPNVRKVNLVKCLRKAKATKAGAGLTIQDLADRLKITKFDAYGLVNGTSGKAGSSPTCLVATGHVQVAKLAEEGLVVSLTKKGTLTEFKEAPFTKTTAAKTPSGNGTAAKSKVTPAAAKS